jgi:hypothetical protein
LNVIGQWRGSDVAVKKLLVDDESVAVKEFVQELSVMLLMRAHENVLMLKGFCVAPRCLVTQFLTGGTLKEYLTEKGQSAEM